MVCTLQPPLPDSYVDCVITGKDGRKRIARLGAKRDCWQLSSYGRVKAQYAWSLKDVVSWKVIDLD